MNQNFSWCYDVGAPEACIMLFKDLYGIESSKAEEILVTAPREGSI